jgi:predicted nucleic acid-binding protein
MTEELAVKANRFVKKGLTGYDACYAALASDLKGCWLTFDKKAHKRIATEKMSCLLSEALPDNWSFE